MYWICVAQYRDMSRAVGNAVLNLPIPEKEENYLPNLRYIRRRILLHGACH